MDTVPGLPREHLRRDGRATLHGTAIVREERGLLLLGPSGSGKSALAAEMLLLGAQLVADDLLLLERIAGGLSVSGVESVRGVKTVEGASQVIGHGRPMELRGIGIVPVPSVPAAPVCGVLLIAPPTARLPEAESVTLSGVRVPMVRQPAGWGTAAKVLLWLAATLRITDAR